MCKIKMRGRIVYFDKVDWCNGTGSLFPKNCEITYPEIVPVVWNFDFHNLDSMLGHAVVSKDELGLICEATLFKTDVLTEVLSENNNEFGIGGYYTRLKDNSWKSGIREIQSAMLSGIGFTLEPANKDYKLVLVEE